MEYLPVHALDKPCTDLPGVLPRSRWDAQPMLPIFLWSVIQRTRVLCSVCYCVLVIPLWYRCMLLVHILCPKVPVCFFFKCFGVCSWFFVPWRTNRTSIVVKAVVDPVAVDCHSVCISCKRKVFL